MTSLFLLAACSSGVVLPGPSPVDGTSSTQDTPASISATSPLEAADPAVEAADDATASDAAAPTADRAFHERPGGSRQVWRRLAADRWALAGGAVVIATIT